MLNLNTGSKEYPVATPLPNYDIGMNGIESSKDMRSKVKVCNWLMA